jgi:hypothetical protein
MKLRVLAAFLTAGLACAFAQSTGGATYTQLTTISPGGPAPTNTFEAPPVPTETTPAVAPNTGSYLLNGSFEITDTPVIRTFNWTIG